MSSSPTTTALIQQLRAELTGEVIAPGDAGYDDARTVFNGAIDRRPAVIARPADSGEVARVVSVAAGAGLALAVRSGGHSGAGHSVTDGGIVLDLAGLRGVEIDAAERTAWAGTGLTAAQLTAATHERGLAVGFGDNGSVGIGGLTLGGGVGYLLRRYGLTIDDLLAAEIVTADGEIRHVDTDTHPDLFWAIRGGGGNFGVATRFRFRLHEVGTIVGGMLLLPATAETIYRFLVEADAAPEELSTVANVMPAPPMPFVPTEHHGELVIMALMAYAGDSDTGQRAVAPFRALAPPIADLVTARPYPQIYPPDDPDYHPAVTARAMFLDDIDRTTTDMIIDRLQASTAPLPMAQLRTLGAAMARVPAEATAFAHRDRRILVNLAAIYQQPDQEAEHLAWVTDFAAALPDGRTGAYVNFLGEEGHARVREAYPGPTWDRLAAIKRRYDPTNLFHLNQNIPPAAT
jgi:FAD/FMN-containing dehydrogenase